MADLPPYPGAPRWVKVSGIVVGLLLLLAVGMMLVDPDRHGPGRHMAGTGAASNHTAPEGGHR
jgi:hypothetical protein